MTENRVRVVAEYCPSCGGVHYPPAEKLGTGMLCTTCRYWQTHDHRVPSEDLRKIAATAGAKALFADEMYGDLVPLEYTPAVAAVIADAVLAVLFDAYEIRERDQVSDSPSEEGQES